MFLDVNLSDEVQTPAATSRPKLAYRPDSAIVLIGTTNRGKTTTMNLFTGNDAEARGGAGATTTQTTLWRCIYIYLSDIVHLSYIYITGDQKQISF